MSFEAVNITDVSTCAEVIRSDNEDNVENLYDKSENNNSTELNVSDEK